MTGYARSASAAARLAAHFREVLNQGSEELNIQEAHAVLQRFAQEITNALMRPLAFD